MKIHDRNVVPPRMLAKLEQGDILGHSINDQGISNKVETWCIV